MKHIKSISKTTAKATALEDFLCSMGQILGLVLTAFGGAAPILNITDAKCVISPPPGSGGVEEAPEA